MSQLDPALFSKDLLEQISDCVFLFDAGRQLSYLNPAAEILCGVSAKDAAGQPLENLLKIEWCQSADQIERELVETGFWRANNICVSANGNKIQAETKLKVVRDARGQQTGRLIIIRKIADCPPAERKSGERQDEEYDLVFSANPIPMTVFDEETLRFLAVNNAAIKQYGWSREEFLKMTVLDIRPPQEHQKALQSIQRNQRVSEETVGVFLHQRKDGSVLEAEVTVSSIPFLGRPGRLCSMVDVTEKKRVQRELRESEERLRLLTDNLPDYAIYQFVQGKGETSGQFTYVSAGIEQLCQVKVETVMGDPTVLLGQVLPEYLEPLRNEILRCAYELCDLHMEVQIRRPDGEIRWLQFDARPHRSPNGMLIWSGVRHDITERKEAEALRQSDERLRALMDHNPSLVFLKDEDGKYVYLNQAYETQFVSSKDWMGKTDFDIWDQASAELFRQNDAITLNSGQAQQFLEDSRDREGKRHCWLCFKFPFTDSKNRKYVGGIGIDATERILAEEALREKQAMIQAFYDSAPFMMGITELVEGKQTTTVSCNRAVVEFLATQPVLGSGKTVTHLGGEKEIEQLWVRNLRRSQRDGCSVSFSYAFPKPAEDCCWYRATVAFIGLGPSGGPRFSFVVEDVTERKRAKIALAEANRELRSTAEALKGRNQELARVSKELHRANAELEQRVEERTEQLRTLTIELIRTEERERRRVAKILHDELQQLLVAAQIHLGSAARRTDPELKRQSLDQTLQMINESLQVSRSLSHDLSLVVLHEQGLLAAIEWMVDWMGRNHNLSIALEGEFESEPEDGNVKIALFQSVRELLLNITKHAGVNEARVRISRSGNGKLVIDVSDEGKGFDPGELLATNKGHFGLFSICERLKALGGQIELESAPSEGSRFRLIAP